jgi:flavodoxin
MNSLVIYDSKFGNTKRVAEKVGVVLAAPAINVSEVGPESIAGLDLLVLGSPTQGGRPTQAIQEFLRQLPADALRGVRVAAFDTRINSRDHGPFLRVLTGVIGYAAGRMTSSLESHGGTAATKPEGFIVEDTEGPLEEGEEERASAWALGLVTSSQPA